MNETRWTISVTGFKDYLVLFERVAGFAEIMVPRNNLVLETGILWFHPKMITSSLGN